MSRELRVTYATASANLYAVIRRISDGYVWNGTAFAVWDNANIADYDVALTDRSGDVYDGDWPSTMAAGDYRILYYVRAGATPAIADLILETQERHWDGAVASSVSEVALSAYALTSLEGLKRHLRITGSDNDTLLTEIINQTTAFIESVAGRQFKARNYATRQNTWRQRRLQLHHWPVISVSHFGYGFGNAMSVTYGGSDVRASVSVNDFGVRLHSVSAGGTTTATDLTFASYPTLSLLETAIEAVTGWTVEVSAADMPSTMLNPTAGESADGRVAWLTYPDIDDVEYSVDYDTGAIEIAAGYEYQWRRWGEPNRLDRPVRMPHQHQGIYIEYRAGYETIPDDVELLCREIAAEKYYIGLDNPSVQSTTLGPYSVTFSRGDLAAVTTTVKHYRDSRVLVG